MMRTARRTKTRTFAELTAAIFGEALTMYAVGAFHQYASEKMAETLTPASGT